MILIFACWRNWPSRQCLYRARMLAYIILCCPLASEFTTCIFRQIYFAFSLLCVISRCMHCATRESLTSHGYWFVLVKPWNNAGFVRRLQGAGRALQFSTRSQCFTAFLSRAGYYLARRHVVVSACLSIYQSRGSRLSRQANAFERPKRLCIFQAPLYLRT